jgi:DNA-binding transcriptional LysR family regulator
MDRLSAIRTFCKVAALESFVAAARALRVSPGVVSKHVGALEDEVGARLVQRSTRHASLTPAGARFYERCAAALAELDLALDEVQGATREPRGPLRVAAPHAFVETWIAPHLAEFATRFPDVRLEVEAAEREVDLIDEALDIAIRITAELPESRLVARRLARWPLVLCASPGYLARRGAPRTLAALADHEWVVAPRHASADAVRVPLAAQRARATGAVVRVASSSDMVLRAAALGGAGLAVLPRPLVDPDLGAGRLVTVLDEHPLVELAVYAVYASRRHLSPNVRVFVDFLAAACSGLEAQQAGAAGSGDDRRAIAQRSSARSGA